MLLKQFLQLIFGCRPTGDYFHSLIWTSGCSVTDSGLYVTDLWDISNNRRRFCASLRGHKWFGADQLVSYSTVVRSQSFPFMSRTELNSELFCWQPPRTRPVIAEDWDRLIMTAGAGDLLLITGSGWCQGLYIHNRNTSPAVLLCWLHYVLFVNSFWHCYKPEYRTPALLLSLHPYISAPQIWQGNMQLGHHVCSHLAYFVTGCWLFIKWQTLYPF